MISTKFWQFCYVRVQFYHVRARGDEFWQIFDDPFVILNWSLREVWKTRTSREIFDFRSVNRGERKKRTFRNIRCSFVQSLAKVPCETLEMTSKIVLNVAITLNLLLQTSLAFPMRNLSLDSHSTAADENLDSKILLGIIAVLAIILLLGFPVSVLIIVVFVKEEEATSAFSHSPCPSYRNFAPPSYKAAMKMCRIQRTVQFEWR